MQILRQFGFILLLLYAGNAASSLLNLPIPGNVLGMMLLLLGLLSGLFKIEMVDRVADFILKHLAFFFIPAGAGIINNVDILRKEWFAMITITVISTVLVMVVTGLTAQYLMRRVSR